MAVILDLIKVECTKMSQKIVLHLLFLFFLMVLDNKGTEYNIYYKYNDDNLNLTVYALFMWNS